MLLVGPTFTRRLWCTVEVFAFLQMGGEHERIRAHALGGLAGDEARNSVAIFDAAKAKCSLAKDREVLLAVIEASFGDLKPFNRLVRNVLGRALSR